MIYNFIVLIINIFFIHSINANSFQVKHIPFDRNDDFISSLQEELRSPHYSREILPNDFSYLSQFLTFGTYNNQPPAYARSAIKLFSNMLKRSRYVNSFTFSQLLEDLPALAKPYFSFPASSRYITNQALYDASFTDRLTCSIYNALFIKFSTEYESFRKSPEDFLQAMSTDIIALAQEEMEQAQMRHSIIKFCDIALNKLIWHPGEQEKTWDLTKKIATQLATLLEHNIIDDTNDLDDLYWTLLNRYCYFIELTATDLSESFYTTLKNDIRTNNVVLFALPEQDCIIEPKLSYMQRIIMEAEITKYEYQHGLLRK